MTNVTVIKKDGTHEAWCGGKIITAVKKAAERCNYAISDSQLETIAKEIKDSFPARIDAVTANELHVRVIAYLRILGYTAIADSYQEYRDYKNTYAKEFEKIKHEADGVLQLGDRENANFDSSLISTKGSLIKGYLTKSLYKQFYLSRTEKELTKRGDIYIHDLRDMILGSFNCSLFDVGNVLKGGFEMANVKYTEPKSVLTALQVIGDITLVASAQQFGGFTVAELDKALIPYCYKTYEAAKALYYSIKYDNANLSEEELEKHYAADADAAHKYAMFAVDRELHQGFQSLELKLNTIPSGRGDFAFTTITFGQWNPKLPELERVFFKLIGTAILDTREKGHGHKQVVFPKLVYLYDEDYIKQDKYSAELFDAAVKCSSKCMYPDYLSLTGNPEKNKVAQVYLASGKKVIVSPMGCRAYLSPWKDPETDEYVAMGRCNIGAVSLNLPVILAVAKKEHPLDWKEAFWGILEDRLQVIRNFLKKRYDFIKHVKAGTNPLAFCQGGLHWGNLDPDDEIGRLTDYMTASFGITALNEATSIWSEGEYNICKDNSFAKRVVQFISDKVDEFKKEDGYLYALYGTPAESLCSTQATQYKEYTGDDQFGTYFTNSFHLHVSEDITPLEKQSGEYELFHMINGGHIQYVRLDNPENLEATRAYIERGMSMGFYQGVNFDSAYCADCGKHSANVMHKCPYCGSTNLTVISRVCGYLGYSNVNGKSRMNDGKLAEIADRKSM